MEERPDLSTTAPAFIAAAFQALREEHVVPTPVYHPYVAVGRDYFGDTIRTLPEFRELERQLDETYPERFRGPVPPPHAEFASSYIFSFLEACIARCGRDRDFGPDARGVEETIDELMAVLGTNTNEVVCCRHVAHMTTASSEEVQIGDVTVVPETEEWGALGDRIQREVRGAARVWNRDDPRPYAPPHSLLIVREIGEDPEPYQVAERLSQRLERFLLLVRLLTAGTVKSTYQVSGATTLVARMNPVMTTFRYEWFGGLVEDGSRGVEKGPTVVHDETAEWHLYRIASDARLRIAASRSPESSASGVCPGSGYTRSRASVSRSRARKFGRNGKRYPVRSKPPRSIR